MSQGDSSFKYAGAADLDLFDNAVIWKRYYCKMLRTHVRGDVLEAGAGNGINTAYLQNNSCTSWTCLEPDTSLAHQSQVRFDAPPALPVKPRVVTGTTADLDDSTLFDAIIYIDVIEHVEHDAEELARAAAHLKPGGALAIMSPAHMWLMSELDRSVGHFRRYSKDTLIKAPPPGLVLRQLVYLDSVGLLASLGNRLMLKRSMPTQKQILFWDRYLIRASIIVDPLLGYRIGKSILGVWVKPGGPSIPF